MKTMTIICGIVLLAGMFALIETTGQRAAKPPAVATQVTNVYSAPEFDMAKHKPTIDDVDPKTILPTNNGYTIDLDGDGVADFVKMEDGHGQRVVCWTKGPVEQHEKVVVLTVKGEVMAYNISVLGGDKLPSVLFWNTERKGFKQKCLGNNAQGIPYFGALEEQ